MLSVHINAMLRSQYSLGFNPETSATASRTRSSLRWTLTVTDTYDDKAFAVRSREVYNSPKPDAAPTQKSGGKQ